MKHFPTTPGARAALLAGAHFLRKEAGDFGTLVKAIEDHHKATNDRLGATDTKMAEFVEQLRTIEQNLDRGGGGGGPAYAPSWGETFTKSRAEDLARIGSERGRTSMEFKATITSATTDVAGSAGDLVVPQRDQLLGMPKRRLTIRNLLSVVQVDSGSVEVPKMTGRTNNAATVAEGAAKPSSDLKFDLQQVPLRVIAHWVKASRQILEDVPQLRDVIDQELRYGLALQEETQLLNGDGGGQNLNGMVTQATAFSDPLALSTPTMIDKLGAAILQTSLTDTLPDGIVIHPSDWWRMRLLKDADGKYILGDPMTVVQPSLFGLPVVATQAMTIDKFLVGSFASQTLYDRWQARVEVGFENDDFTKNLVTILAEERVGFAAKRPEALIHGDFGFVV